MSERAAPTATYRWNGVEIPTYCTDCGRRLREVAVRDVPGDWGDDSVVEYTCPVCAALGPQPRPIAVRLRGAVMGFVESAARRGYYALLRRLP